MKYYYLLYIGIGYRYRPIWKISYRYFIGIGRYENWIYRWLSVSADMEKTISFVHWSWLCSFSIFGWSWRKGSKVKRWAFLFKIKVKSQDWNSLYNNADTAISMRVGERAHSFEKSYVIYHTSAKGPSINDVTS